MDLKLIGLNIKNCRNRMKLTQAQLAEIVDLSTNHISHIESGSSKMSLDTLIDICNALNVSPNEILWGTYNLLSDTTASTDIDSQNLSNTSSDLDIFRESPNINNVIFSNAEKMSEKNKRLLLEITKLLSE